MTVRNLGKGNYYKCSSIIDRMVIEMYQEITSGLLHDESPLKIATDINDIWEIIANSLYENQEISHKEFLKLIGRIIHYVTECEKSLGVETGVLDVIA